MSTSAEDLSGSTGRILQQPIHPGERIESIDVLRGAAVLGILVINVWVLALPDVAYVDVSVRGGNAYLNRFSWAVSHLVIEGKMRALLSLLFGAGVILLTGRIESRGGHADVTDIYYRRTIWLVVFGVAQSYLLIWAVDFIYAFALVGLLLFPFRKMRGESLIAVGLMLLAVLVPLRIHWSNQLATTQPVVGTDQVQQENERSANNSNAQTAPPRKAANNEDGDDLTPKEPLRVSLWIVKPSRETAAQRIQRQRSDYSTIFKQNVPAVVDFQSTQFYTRYFWDVAGMMFIGMGLAKLGLFHLNRTASVYAMCMVVGYGVGGPLSVFMTYSILKARFEPSQLFFIWVIYDSARLAVTLGHVGLVMLICKKGLWPWLTDSLAATGRMALSNYIGQTVICTLLFNGYGLGLYGRPELWHTSLLAAMFGLCQMIFSTYWLRVFCFGPMEWLWRTLTYVRWQPALVSSTARKASTVDTNSMSIDAGAL